MAQIGVDIQLSVSEIETLLEQIEAILDTKLNGEQILKLKEVLIRQKFRSEHHVPF